MKVFDDIRSKNIVDYGQKFEQWAPRILVDQYSDKTHFIYELLQNAEDAEATSVEIILEANMLTLKHDGRDFTEEDVRGICGVSASSKGKTLSRIGRFGIGFKSVYAYTQKPHIISGGFNFEIRNLIMPYAVSTQSTSVHTTIELPFDAEYAGSSPFSEIAIALRKYIVPDCMLTLSNIHKIKYTIGGSEVRTIEKRVRRLGKCILTKSVSRFARNTVDTLTTIRKLKEHGVSVYFEEQSINTLDGKGELLITIMSSIAQEESRSISDNVTWGKRKSASDGKISIGYKHFLGYEKGEDGLPRVIEEQAKIVRYIYRSFMMGKTATYIAQALTEAGVPSPGSKKVWQESTIMSILQNEKYKGAALLQKRFTVDFLEKRMKVNEGEVPQYYIEHSHEAIIDPVEHDRVQLEISRRKAMDRRYCSAHTFSSRVICGDCGSFYGRKVWHSTDPYKRIIWRCNEKYRKEQRCATPHLTEAELKARFVDAYNQRAACRTETLADCQNRLASISDMSEIDAEIDCVSA